MGIKLSNERLRRLQQALVIIPLGVLVVVSAALPWFLILPLVIWLGIALWWGFKNGWESWKRGPKDPPLGD